MQLALFDLDNTLLSGDSDFEWAQFLIAQGVLDRAGTLDIHEFLDFQLKPLSRHPRTQLDAWHRDFMASRIRPIMRERARELIARHAGDLCVIVTATNSFVTAPIAREFRVAHLVATEPEVRGGEFTGRVAGTPCFREGKLVCLEQWLAGRGLTLDGCERSWFYSDSHNDLPLLLRVTDPVAVNPDDTLHRHAEQHGWSVISLA
jgi:HAD superfamily hydrolase (TIGR01490 family)